MKLLPILATAVIAAAACCNPNQKELTVVPYPNSVDINCGVFKANGADFNYDAAIDARSTALISSFAEQLSLVSGTQNKLVEATEGNGFLFLLDEQRCQRLDVFLRIDASDGIVRRVDDHRRRDHSDGAVLQPAEPGYQVCG